ncbi:MAG: cellulase family glycosylhydrolase [Clostridia bacterium]|nr:cellulase family glycosylhydrolase [Clostridia bacterium]
MRLLKKTFCLVLALVMALSTMTLVSAETAKAEINEVTGFTAEDFLTVKGRKMFNQKGEEVQLKGVNLGGWLIHEDWLCPDELPKGVQYDHETILEILEERFGREKAHELTKLYEENWITEYDLDIIKDRGFNCVRVPFWYRNFYFDDKGTKILDENGEWDFSILDWIIEECAERELYVILDMHGAVGSQSDAPHSGRAFQGAQLYENEEYQRLTVELWQAIASRYADSPTVAMYDLLNEPMCDVECTEIERRMKNEFIYGLLYDAVREVDKEHIITMEAIWTGFALPKTFLKGWDNIVYQVHFYNNSDFIFNFFLLLTIALHPNVPLMVGEFYPHQKTTWSNCFSTMNKLNYSWMLWTYKATGHGMWSSDWCMFGAKDGFWNADIANGTYEDIAYAWGPEQTRTENNFQDTGHYDNNVKEYL